MGHTVTYTGSDEQDFGGIEVADTFFGLNEPVEDVDADVLAAVKAVDGDEEQGSHHFEFGKSSGPTNAELRERLDELGVEDVPADAVKATLEKLVVEAEEAAAAAESPPSAE
jgi:hypothetical protein